MLEQRNNIFEQISVERERQDKLHPEFPIDLRMEILAEEIGEVAKAKLDGDMPGLRKELLEVAAVCVRWVETMDHNAIGAMRNCERLNIEPTYTTIELYRAAIARRTF